MGTISIPLTQGKYALIDEEDFALVSQYKWWARKSSSKNTVRWYVVRTIRLTDGRWIEQRLHRFLLHPPVGIDVDHVNGNVLDNRRCNLRLATRSENSRNRHTVRGASKYLGVFFKKQTGRWMAQIVDHGTAIHLGYFDSEVEAALAYDEAASRIHGEFAHLNLPGRG
jgi:hypothetical protein